MNWFKKKVNSIYEEPKRAILGPQHTCEYCKSPLLAQVTYLKIEPPSDAIDQDIRVPVANGYCPECEHVHKDYYKVVNQTDNEVVSKHSSIRKGLYENLYRSLSTGYGMDDKVKTGKGLYYEYRNFSID